jgi:hypothetical protein
MPGFDKTGPKGQGPLTGRRRGYCSGNETEIITGMFDRGHRWGLARGDRGRAGMGWRWRGPDWKEADQSVQERIESEIRVLQEQIAYLEKKLEGRKSDEKKQNGKD